MNTKSTRLRAAYAAAAIVLFALAGAAQAAPRAGDLDRSFDGPSYGAGAALQPDGMIVVSGLDASGLDVAVVRFERDGSLDRSFGTGGRKTVDLGFVEIASEVALQRDGRIVLAGQGAGGTPVLRLLGDSAPVVSGLRLLPRSFARGNALPRPGAARPQVRFTVSEPARVRFTFQRARLGGYTTVPGSFTVGGRAGLNRVRFEGRLSARRWLAPGQYRLVARAVDRAGNAGDLRRAVFRLLDRR